MTRYGVSFLVLGLLLGTVAVVKGGWSFVLLWLALCLCVLSAGYFGIGARVFGKQKDGSLSAGLVVLHLPWLFYTWAVWHLMRIISRETVYSRVTDDLVIGRRLLVDEMVEDVDAIVDLTAEFVEQKTLVAQYKYFSFPILDGGTPEAGNLKNWLQSLDTVSGRLYIHCAQGHGRTGMFTAALLLHRRMAFSVSEAITIIQNARGGVKLSRSQRAWLDANFPNVGKDR